MSVALTARKLTVEEYVQVQEILVRSFLKVPNRTLHYRTKFRLESKEVRSLEELADLYEAHLALALIASENEGNHLPPAAASCLEDLRTKLDRAVADNDVEQLIG